MGDGVAVIAVTSVAANMWSIVAGMVVFGDPLGDDFLVVKLGSPRSCSCS